MNCASDCTRPRSISSSVGPSAASFCDLVDDDRFELRQRVARGGGRGDLHEARDLARVLRGRHVGGDALVEDQPAVQPRRLAVGENVGGQIELGVARRRTSAAVSHAR